MVVGGQLNQACDGWSIVAGGYDNAVSGTSDDSFIGAGDHNVVTGNDYGAAVVAGYNNQVSGPRAAIVTGYSNSLAAPYSLIGAGVLNTITPNGSVGAIVAGNQNTLSEDYGFIGGGYVNTVSAQYGVVAGGTHNTVSGEGGYVGAGGYNIASGQGALIGGGYSSAAAGNFATIPGGYANNAAGTYSLAAGARASAAQNGTFVWSDGSDGDTILTSSRAYEFLARASGGFTLWTNAASTVGAQLAAGSGTWASLSDRNAKTAIVPLDDDAVLAKVDALPISRWSYRSERGVRHVGPMAQDFYAAFGVGEDDKHITSIDEDGVALAAIKALHAQSARLRDRIGALDVRNTAQSSEIAQLRRELDTERAHDRLVDAELSRIAAAQRR